MADLQTFNRFYLSYSGIKLPLKLVSPIDASETDNRNTFFAARESEQGCITEIAKVVYGEIELHHSYSYREDHSLSQAVITAADGETQTIRYNEQGLPCAS